MTTTPDPLADRFWPLFSRVMGRSIEPGLYGPQTLPEWDSLRHVELVFELETAFGIGVPPDRIAGLYSDTDAVLAFLREKGAA